MHRKRKVRKWGNDPAGTRTRLPRLLRGSYPRLAVPHCWRAKSGGLRATGYYVGGTYHWETPEPGAEGVQIGLRADGFLWRDASGEVLFYFGLNPYGFPLEAAMLAGFCWLAEDEVEGCRTVAGFVDGMELFSQTSAEGSHQSTFHVQDGVRIETDEAGRIRFRRGTYDFSLPLETARKLGWCRRADREIPQPGECAGERRPPARSGCRTTRDGYSYAANG